MASAPPPSASDGAFAAALAGLIAMASAMGVGRFVYTPILPGMMRATGLTAADAGAIASANFLGYLLGALAAAPLAQLVARPASLCVALAASAATTAAMAAADGFAAFAVIRFLSGLASAFVFVGATTLVLEALARRDRVGLHAVHFAGPGAGIAASALLVAAAALAGGDWRAEWLVSGLAQALALAVVALLLPRESATAAAPSAAPAPASGVAPLVLAYGLVGFGYVITATFLVAIVRESGVASGETLVWLALGLAAALSIAPWSALARRIGLERAFALACLAEAVGVAASVLWPGFAGALLAALLLGGTFIALTALGLAATRRRVGGDGRRVVAAMTAAFGLGQIVGPFVAGRLREASGDYVAASLAAALALLVAAGVALLRPRG
jgi:predicted MFS family arabinose efflux permease